MSQPDVICAGILVVDIFPPPLQRLPKAGELVVVDDMQLLLGGCAANAAAGLARQGVNVAVSARVGSDSFGDLARGMLSDLGVQTGLIRTSAGEGTSKTIMLPVQGEDRRFIHTFGANASYQYGDLDLEQVRKAKVLFMAGWFGVPGFRSQDLADLFKFARENGVTTVLDVLYPRGASGSELFDSLAPALRYTDYFLPNTDEAEALTGETDPERQAERFFEAGASTVIITMGGEGALTRTSGRRIRTGVYQVPYVDGTGSGDAFAAGFIAALLQGKRLEHAITYGSAVAAGVVQAIGATAGQMTREQTEAFIAARQLPFQTQAL